MLVNFVPFHKPFYNYFLNKHVLESKLKNIIESQFKVRTICAK